MEKNNNYLKILVMLLIIFVFYLVTRNNYETFDLGSLIRNITSKYPPISNITNNAIRIPTPTTNPTTNPGI